MSDPTYDAVLLFSFGGPEQPADVMPFLEHVVRGRRVPHARLEKVAQHYYARGGASPLNGINRALRSAIERELAAGGTPLPVYWGNRHWHPFVADTVRQMRDDGIRRALAFVTSAYSSYSACRQYQDELRLACASVGERAPAIDRIRHYFDHPGFITPFVESTVAALDQLPAGSHLVFTAHSIPEPMAAASGPVGGLYPAQLQAAAALVYARVAERCGADVDYALVYQSQSTVMDVSWLGPDVIDHLRHLAARGAPGAVAVPIGFTADHMEVVHDLGVEAAGVAAELGLPFARAATPGVHPAYVAMIAELARERLGGQATRRALSPLGPAHDECPVHCCLHRR